MLCFPSTDSENNPEKRLFNDLMVTYDKNSRPVLNANSSVDVNFAVELKQIMELVSSDVKQFHSVHMWPQRPFDVFCLVEMKPMLNHYHLQTYYSVERS